ncbi:transcriptional regulator [Litchfieldella qijiaojingensis]|uniref:Transcriptional regulator n=1 Tax=Litchfieldella qijiaojingensis TaxID=980347 RepID=A0ABQ2YCI6_9GAMM|nr:metalloregulator ArsR/SmtB family transcription factor [Halomonas qijiaojingensis]GGX79876.1 transcriptional regulator [Halomonas qijiaojingensis]
MTEQATRLFKCLADDTRLAILLLVQAEEELCVCELTHVLATSQPKISRHLAQLRACQLVADRRQGQWVYYRLHPELPAWAHEVLETTARGCHAQLADMRGILARMGNRPERQQACC